MFNEITEEDVKIIVPSEKKVSKKLPVFYNPIMKFNRDMSILLLNVLNKKGMQIALPLAGTGVRGIRFLKELKRGKIKNVFFNDSSENAVKLIEKNLKNNSIKSKYEISNKDANLFLLEGKGFDYIDIDPFGSPNPFLDSAMKRLARDGILAVTATDTSALSGTYPKACRRKYWAKPLRNELMHETGLRILIRKVQLIGAQYDKALTPLFSYSRDHYMRVFFKCDKGKSKVDPIMKNHGMWNDAGPMWLGRLWNEKLVKVMNADDNFIAIIKEESKIDVVGFFDLHVLAKKHKFKHNPKKETIIEKLRKAGFKASNTHFSGKGIRTDACEDDLLSLI